MRIRDEPRRAAFVFLALLAGLALVLGACGDDEDTGTTAGAGTTTGPAAPGPGSVTSTTLDPDPTAKLPDLPINKDPSAVQCTGAPEGIFDATAIVDEPIEAATQAAADVGCEIRIVAEDGKSLAVTDDFRPDRVNVVVEDGTVIEIDSIG